MGDFSKSVVTHSGVSLENKAMQLQKAIRFIKVVTGDGWLSEGQHLASLTELIHDVQDYDLGSANTLINNQATLRFTIDSSQVKKAYQLREVGVLAQIDDDPTTLTLFCVANAGDTADTIVPSHGSAATRDQYTIVIEASNKVKVTAKIVIEDQIPLHAATHLTDGDDPIPLVTSERAGLVPVGPDDDKKVLVGVTAPRWDYVPLADKLTQGAIPVLPGLAGLYLAGDGRWHRMTPFIMANTTLYVDPSNRDNPPKFSTLARALEYLNDYQIFAGATVTVELADGTHKIENVIEFDHPQAQQVRIVGASQRQSVGFTEMKQDDDDLILRVESVRGLSVGMMSNIIQIGGPNWNMHPGGHTVRHIEAPYVTFSRSRLHEGPIQHEYKGLKECYLYFYKTEIDCPKGGLALPNGLALLSRMAMRGSWVPKTITGNEPVFEDHGVFTMGRAFFSDLIVRGFVRGISARYSHFDLKFVAAYECSDGILADVGSSMTSSGTISCNGNTGSGILVQQAIGQLGSDNYYSNWASVFLKGNGVGMAVGGSSHVWLSKTCVELNQIGIIADGGGFAMVGNDGQVCYVRANHNIDMLAANGGFIRGWSRGGFLGSTNPPNRSFANDIGYIAIDNN